MPSGITIPNADIAMADAFESKADDFAVLAEEAKTAEDCIRYRDIEQSFRLRASEERARQMSALYVQRHDHAAA
jgi:hypothetical protein